MFSVCVCVCSPCFYVWLLNVPITKIPESPASSCLTHCDKWTLAEGMFSVVSGVYMHMGLNIHSDRRTVHW